MLTGSVSFRGAVHRVPWSNVTGTELLLDFAGLASFHGVVPG